MAKFVERGVRVKLRVAARQHGQEAGEVALVHAGVLQQAEDAVGGADFRVGEAATRAGGQAAEDECVAGPVKPLTASEAEVQGEWVVGDAQEALMVSLIIFIEEKLPFTFFKWI